MPYSNCIGNVAQSIQQDCNNPLVAGYTGRGICVPYNTDGLTLTVSSTNPRILNAVAIGTDAKVVAINNVMVDPFTGSSKAGNTDSGMVKFTKTVAVKIPLRGAAVSKDLIEPLAVQPLGFLLILEKRDKNGAGSFEVVGLKEAAKVDPASITQNESENGGAWVMNFVSTEMFGECEFVAADGTYATTLTNFETLLAKGY